MEGEVGPRTVRERLQPEKRILFNYSKNEYSGS